MIRTLVVGIVCCTILLVGVGCQSEPAAQQPPVGGLASAADTPATDHVKLPMAEVAEAIYRIAKDADLNNVSASWLDHRSTMSGQADGGSPEQPAPKPRGIDAMIEASSNTGSAARACVRTTPDGGVSVVWDAQGNSDRYLVDFWRARFHMWLKNPKATTHTEPL